MIEKVYEQIVELKNFLYASHILDSVSLPLPVISVGNLTTGGSGKTPFVGYLLELATQKKIQTLVVSKNYKAQSRGFKKVDIKHPKAATFFGDEALMLALRFPQQKFWTGPQKYITAQKALQKEKVDLVIIDDGFQHRQLVRNFDVVLVDVSLPPEHYQLLPHGNMREGFSNLERADLVVFTKVNRRHEITAQLLKLQIESVQKSMLKPFEILEAEYRPSLRNPLTKGERVLLVSGIAHPPSFVAAFEEYRNRLGVEATIADHLTFPDHHPYQQIDFERILKAQKELGCDRVITTEKDFVKLKNWSAELIMDVMDVQINMLKEPRGIYEFFDQIHRS